ncbi:hypothetical protein [Nostoc sp. NMS1]|nr:hypothetical protein [Nostoc sp. NMS1]
MKTTKSTIWWSSTRLFIRQSYRIHSEREERAGGIILLAIAGRLARPDS